MLQTVSLLQRRWFAAIVVVSAILALITLISFPMERHGAWSTLLFELGYAGENNVGAWWSGMLLLLSAVLAVDGYLCAEKAPAERRGWLALSAVLLMLSFDEIASVHEAIGLRHIVPFGLAGLAVTSYALIELHRGGVSMKRLAIIVAAFALFGTVGLQEKIQHLLVWRNEWVYGARALLEEGIEIIGMLMLLGVTRSNTARMLAADRPDAFAAIARFRAPLLGTAFVLAPVMTAATYVLPYPGGPADWLAGSLYLLCALLVVRRFALSGSAPTAALVVLLLFYLVASAGSNAVDLEWDPAVLGTRVGVRGVYLALLLFASAPILRANGRHVGAWPILGGALALLAAAEWPESQLIWCLAPALLAVAFFASESKVVAVATTGARADTVDALAAGAGAVPNHGAAGSGIRTA
jgi:succinate-acetate transporter protein